MGRGEGRGQNEPGYKSIRDITAPQPRITDADLDATGPINTRERWWKKKGEPKLPRHGRRALRTGASLAVLAGLGAAGAGVVPPPNVEAHIAPYYSSTDVRAASQPSASADPDRSRQPIAGSTANPDRSASPIISPSTEQSPTASFEPITASAERGAALTDFYKAINVVDAVLSNPISPGIETYSVNAEVDGGVVEGGEMDLYLTDNTQNGPDIRFSGGRDRLNPNLADVEMDFYLDRTGTPITAEAASALPSMTPAAVGEFAKNLFNADIISDWTQNSSGVGGSTRINLPGLSGPVTLAVTVRDNGSTSFVLSGDPSILPILLPELPHPPGS